MANFVKCKFAFIGNEAINELVKEIKKRIVDDIKIHEDYSDTSRVGRIFYGLQGQDAVLGHETLRSKWIHDDQDYDGIGFVGGWNPVRGFQDHLLKYASKLDPKLIVLMEYEDESPNFVGARYVMMKEGKIAEYESELDLSNILVTFDGDYDDAVIKNEETNEYEEIILWEDLYYKINDCRRVAFMNMRKANSWIPENYVNRNPDNHS